MVRIKLETLKSSLQETISSLFFIYFFFRKPWARITFYILVLLVKKIKQCHWVIYDALNFSYYLYMRKRSNYFFKLLFYHLIFYYILLQYNKNSIGIKTRSCMHLLWDIQKNKDIKTKCNKKKNWVISRLFSQPKFLILGWHSNSFLSE